MKFPIKIGIHFVSLQGASNEVLLEKISKTCLLFDIRSSSGAKIRGKCVKWKSPILPNFPLPPYSFRKIQKIIPPLTMKKILNGKYFIRVTLHVPHPVKTFNNAVVFSLFIRFSKTKSAWQSSFNCTNFCSIDANELTRRQRTAIHQCEPTLNYILSKWHSKYFSYFETEQPLNKRTFGKNLKKYNKTNKNASEKHGKNNEWNTRSWAQRVHNRTRTNRLTTGHSIWSVNMRICWSSKNVQNNVGYRMIRCGFSHCIGLQLNGE